MTASAMPAALSASRSLSCERLRRARCDAPPNANWRLDEKPSLMPFQARSRRISSYCCLLISPRA
jgi:hypothetical protein